MAKNTSLQLIRLLKLAGLCLGIWGLSSSSALAQVCNNDPQLQAKIQQLNSFDREQLDQVQEQIATQYGAKAVDCLVNLIGDESKNLQHRIQAIWTLSAMGADAKSSVPDLVSVVKNGDDALSLAAINVLGNLSVEGVSLREQDPSILNVLVAEFQPNRPLNLRIAALTTLNNMGAESVDIVSDLIAILADPELEIKILTVDVLYRIGPAAANSVSPLINLLQHTNDIELQTAIIGTLGTIGFAAQPAIPELKTFLADPDQQVRSAAAKSLNQIANALANSANDSEQLPTSELRETIRHLEESLQTLKENANQFDVEDVASIQRSLVELQREQAKREWAVLKHPVAIVLEVYMLLFAISLMLLLFLPTALLRLNYLLRPFTLTIPTPFGGISLSAQQLVLVKFFNSHPRVLDAWVEARIDKAKDRFAHKSTVQERQIYVPLPVVLNDRTATDLKPTDLKATFAQNRWRLLIWGEGGIGKTTLACQIAQWAMAVSATDRPCVHRMLPVLIEEGLDSPVGQDKQPLLEVICGQLQNLLDETDAIDEELLLNLLKYQRLLVIVDRFSEMSQTARLQIQPSLSSFPVNALLVTSRMREPLNQSVDTTIMPLGIVRDRLSDFVSLYLLQQGKSYLFNDGDRHEACVRLSQMVGQRSLTVLLAKLYLDQLIAFKSIALDSVAAQLSAQLFEASPNNIPDLILYYLNRLNQSVTENRLENELVQQDAKLIAWECLQRTYRPDWIKRQTALTTLGGDNAAARLNYLQDRLNIVKASASGDRVRISLDPVAEYLAAMRVIELYGVDENAWRGFFDQVDARLGAAVAIQGFLSALEDYCLSLGKDDVISALILTELDQRFLPPNV